MDVAYKPVESGASRLMKKQPDINRVILRLTARIP
jgi:hypothetical protein